MLAGKQVDRWDNVKKYNLGAISGAIARQSSRKHQNLVAEPEKAVDGIINPFWAHESDGKFNSISETDDENEPWWEVQLNEEYLIEDVVIYNRQDPCCIDMLSDFKVTVYSGATIEWEGTFPLPDEGKEGIKKYHVRIADEANEAILGNRVRITLNKYGSLQLAEVEVMGRKDTDDVQSVEIPIGDMFHDSNAPVRYISFIQDNDEDHSFGESEFSNIELVEVEETLVVSSCTMFNFELLCESPISYLVT